MYYGSPAQSFSQIVEGVESVSLDSLLEEFGVFNTESVKTHLGGVGDVLNTNKEELFIAPPGERNTLWFWQKRAFSKKEAKELYKSLDPKNPPVSLPECEKVRIIIEGDGEATDIYLISVVADKPQISWDEYLLIQKEINPRYNKKYPKLDGVLDVKRFVKAGCKIGFMKAHYTIQEEDMEDIPLFGFFHPAKNEVHFSEATIQAGWSPASERVGDQNISVYPLRQR